MKIGVIADTHLYHRAAALPWVVMDIFHGADHVIHAGDIVDMAVIEQLESVAPVTAVAGNLDPPKVHEKYGDRKSIPLGGFAFGVCHGDGKKGRTVDRAAACFQDQRVDCIVFGHSHIPYCRYHGDILLFNPGSPTDKRRNRYYSVGLIEVDKGIWPRLVYFDGEGSIIRHHAGESLAQ